MKRLIIIGGSVAIVLIVILAIVFFVRPYVFHGTVIQSPDPAYDFTLEGTSGPVSLSDFRGKVVVLYFGYTFCPDVCPATMADLARTMEDLGKRAGDVQVIMVSVDPGRDTPETVEKYVQTFDPSFIGLTGTEAQIAETASMYGIYYFKHEGTAATGYLIDHTASMMVINQDGRLKLVLSFGTPPADIAADLKHMIN
jgi:protein SCO1